MAASETFGGGGGEADRRTVAVGNDRRYEEFFLRICEKLDRLRKEVRAKKVLLHVKGIDDPTLPARPMPNFSRLPARAVSTDATRPIRDVTSPQTREEVNKMGRTYLDTLGSFEALETATRLAQRAEVLTSALTDSADARVMLDEEEVHYVEGLLAEHKDLTLQIFDLENSRLSSQLELLELSSREADLRQQSFKGLLVEKSNGNSDDDQTPSEEVKRKRCQLQAEEKKLNQMRFMLQKLIFAHYGDDDAHGEDQVAMDDMMRTCGEDLSTLTAKYLK